MKNKKYLSRLKRHRSLRLRMSSNPERPRLVVRRTLKNLYADIIDDTRNKILFSLSTLDKDIRQKFVSAGNSKAAQFFGEIFALKAKEKGFSKIIFDRAGYLYHGRIKTFAESLRKGGMDF